MYHAHYPSAGAAVCFNYSSFSLPKGGGGGALPHHEPPHHHRGHSCRVFLASGDQLCPCHEEMTIITATAFRCLCVWSPLAAFVLHSSPVPPPHPAPPRSFSFFSSVSLIYTPTHPHTQQQQQQNIFKDPNKQNKQTKTEEKKKKKRGGGGGRRGGHVERFL